jgi:hypothetical protein
VGSPKWFRRGDFTGKGMTFNKPRPVQGGAGEPEQYTGGMT